MPDTSAKLNIAYIPRTWTSFCEMQSSGVKTTSNL